MADLKDLRKLIRRVERITGWSVEHRRNGHLRFVGPDGTQVWAAGSPSDRHACHQIERDLRRHGCPL